MPACISTLLVALGLNSGDSSDLHHVSLCGLTEFQTGKLAAATLLAATDKLQAFVYSYVGAAQPCGSMAAAFTSLATSLLVQGSISHYSQMIMMHCGMSTTEKHEKKSGSEAGSLWRRSWHGQKHT